MVKKTPTKKTKKKKLDMAELTKGYESFIEGKEVNPNGKEMFDTVIKKTLDSKQKRAAK